MIREASDFSPRSRHDKAYLHGLFREIEQYLCDRLHLSVKRNWQVFPTYVRGIDFVGYRSFGDYTLLEIIDQTL